MFRNLLFDFDNTLYDYTICYNYALKRLFITLEKYINDNLSPSQKTTIVELETIFNDVKSKYQNMTHGTAASHNKFNYIKRFINEIQITYNHYTYNTFVLSIYNTFVQDFNSQLSLYDGVIDFLKLCKENNITLFMLTNNLSYEQFSKLHNLNITNYFQHIYCSEEYGCEKPDPKLFYTVLGENNILRDDIAIVGDSMKCDIAGANQTGEFGFYFTNDSLVNINKQTDYITFSSFKHLSLIFKNYFTESIHFKNMCSYCGERFDLVQAGGGNISFKTDNTLFVKSSGCNLTDIDIHKNYVGVKYKNIIHDINNIIKTTDKKQLEKYSSKIVNDNILFLKKYKPSIETTMHCITKKYTVHIHPLAFSSICGLSDCKELINKHFNDVCFIDYVTPGISVTQQLMDKYTNENIIFLKNHGIVVTSDDPNEIYNLLENTIKTLEKMSGMSNAFNKYKHTNYITSIIKEYTNENTVSSFIDDIQGINNIETTDKIIGCTFFPDKLIYCGESLCTFENNIELDKKSLIEYINVHHDIPKIIRIETFYYTVSSSLKKNRDIQDVLKSHILTYHEKHEHLEKEEIEYLNNWDAEKYRKKIE